MSKRRVRIVILCEDSQHETFVRRFLKGMGWNIREIRVEKSPSASGSAEQWVRESFPKELKIYRQRQHQAASGLIAIIDADNKRLSDRMSEFTAVCESEQIEFRNNDEAVDNLVQFCKSTGLDQDAPKSLTMACREYGTRIQPLSCI